MATRRTALLIGIIGCLAALPAHADPRSEVAAKTKAAMASYDSMDYEAARRLLNQALATAKKAKLDKDPLVARAYLNLGIAQLAASDPEAAKLSFLSAVQIDPKITIEAAYKSAELVKLLEEARAAAGADSAPEDSGECRRGVTHTVIETGKAGVAQPIEATVGGDPAKVVVMYRPEGAVDFTEVRLTKQGGCRYAGAIPAAGMHGALVHYYIAAYDASNKVLAAKGSSGAPNILELTAGGRSNGNDTENPIVEPAATTARVSRASEPSTPSAPPRHRVVIGLAGGTGFGYVSGKTESDNVVQTCCIGTSLLVLTPELAYYASARLSIGVAARIGFPIGANIEGHSTAAPAGLLRVRYALSRSGDGLRVMGEIGGGIVRNTIQLSSNKASDPGMDTDIVAQGPLLLGAGIGYTRHLGGSFAFFVDLAAIAGIAVVDKVGSAVHLNTGVSADLSLGVAVGF